MFIQNPDYLYVQKVKALCCKIDDAVKKFITRHDFIEKSKADTDKKINRFKGWRLLLLWVIVCVALVIPFSLISLFTDIPVWLALPPISVAIVFSFKFYYEKKIIPIHNDAYNQITSIACQDIEQATAELNEYKKVYESETKQIPDILRHQFVLDILGEAIRQGYAGNLQEAIVFYRTQLGFIEQDKTEAALQIQREILDSEKSADERIKVFTILNS